jgi:hypothetical protein
LVLFITLLFLIIKYKIIKLLFALFIVMLQINNNIKYEGPRKNIEPAFVGVRYIWFFSLHS